MSKIALVTGASRGIGYEISRSFARQNHQVVAIARSKDLLKQLQQEFPENILSVPTDLAKEKEVSDLVSTVKRKFAGVDILINNAGALINKPFRDLTMEEWRKLMEINLISAVHLTKQLLPFFNKNAHIVNISSMGGFQGSAKFPGLSAYSVSKGGLSILSECLAVELKDEQIKVNTLCLGAVLTEMFEEAFPGIEAPVKPDQMGEYITHFALEASSFYNGQVLPVTGSDPE